MEHEQGRQLLRRGPIQRFARYLGAVHVHAGRGRSTGVYVEFGAASHVWQLDVANANAHGLRRRCELEGDEEVLIV